MAALGVRFQTRGRVHGVSDRGVLRTSLRPDVADGDFASVQPDSDSDLGKTFLAQFKIDPDQTTLHRHGGGQRVRGVIWSDSWGAKQRHQSITEILIERATVRKDDVGHRREITVEQLHDLLRRRMFRDAREATNIGKEDRDCLKHAAQFERVGIFQHLRDYVLGQKAAVVRARDFFTREALVRPDVFNRDGGLRGHGAH